MVFFKPSTFSKIRHTIDDVTVFLYNLKNLVSIFFFIRSAVLMRQSNYRSTPLRRNKVLLLSL